jgi:hypothetical protein
MYVQATSLLYPDTAMEGEQMHRRASSALFHRSIARGRRRQLASMLTGRSRCLLRLADVEATLEVHDRCNAGVQTVPIDQIRGSGDRAHDFDCDFYPLQTHTRARWQGIALARQKGTPLPPVALIQIGDIYFVLDGHHRISVARARGQKEIEARVTVWHVKELLLWAASASTPSHWPAGQPVGVARVAREIQRASTQLEERFQQRLQRLLSAVGIALRARNRGDTEELLWT